MVPPTRFSGASPEMLQEISREAESYLQAQLTSGIAADQRAVAFTSLLAAAAAVVGGGGVTLLLRSPPDPLGWVGLWLAGGLIAAMFFAIQSALPVTFWYPGNSPEKWIDDVQSGQSLDTSIAQQLEHYLEQINENKDILDGNGRLMRLSIWTAWGSLAAACILAMLTLLAR